MLKNTLGVLLITIGGVALAQSLSIGEIKKTIAEAFEIPADTLSVSESTLPGFKFFELQGNVGMISDDGKYLINGDVIEMATLESLTQTYRRGYIVEEMKQLDRDMAVVFAAQNEKAQISVFSDVDCFYCQKLHREIDQLNRLGITVKYYSYPRSGDKNASDWQRASRVWCAIDRQAAMTIAKRPASVAGAKQHANCEAFINEQYSIGKKIGVRGTPTIVLSNGQLIPGYQPAEQLASSAIQANETVTDQ